jgi:acylphosphatase
VGFRYATQRKARELGVRGWVRNLQDGSVEVLAGAGTPAMDAFSQWLHQGPPGAAVEVVEHSRAAPEDLPEDFRIV